MGLGLAIVKKIADLYGYETSYFQGEKKHTLKVQF